MRWGPYVTCALVLALGACSFAFVHGPARDTDPPSHYPACTESRVLPVLDLLVGAPYAVLGVMAASGNLEDTGDNEDAQVGGAIVAVLAGVLVASGVSGIVKTGRCAKARAAFRTAHPYGVPYGPATAPPQPYPQPYPRPYPQPGYPPPGYEGGACLANNACAPGLTCASGLCVRVPAPTAPPPPPAAVPPAAAPTAAPSATP